MIWEFLQWPVHLFREKNDWTDLTREYPRVVMYSQQKVSIESLIRAAYQDYVRNYSSGLISLSLNRACFIYFLIKAFQVQKTIDLGTGISSYVSLLASKAVTGSEVISVDDNEYWLEKTRAFLHSNNLPGDNLILLKDFLKDINRVKFGACILDIGDYKLRKQLFPQLAASIKEHGGFIFVDDFHVPAYRSYIETVCDELQLRVYSLRKVTRRRLSHAALVVSNASTATQAS